MAWCLHSSVRQHRRCLCPQTKDEMIEYSPRVLTQLIVEQNTRRTRNHGTYYKHFLDQTENTPKKPTTSPQLHLHVDKFPAFNLPSKANIHMTRRTRSPADTNLQTHTLSHTAVPPFHLETQPHYTRSKTKSGAQKNDRRS